MPLPIDLLKNEMYPSLEKYKARGLFLGRKKIPSVVFHKWYILGKLLVLILLYYSCLKTHTYIDTYTNIDTLTNMNISKIYAKYQIKQ